MDVSLDGKVLLVTGSTQGIGAAIADLAAQSGAIGIMLTGRDLKRGTALASRLNSSATKVAFVQADLADDDAPSKIAAATLEQFGRIDLLVNAAALTDRASFLDGEPDFWDRLFTVNAKAPYFLMQAAIRDLLKRKAPGAIVNILSMNAHCGAPELAIYSATKGALATLTKNAAHAHLADRIRANGIMMGWASTPGEKTMQGDKLGKGAAWEAEAAASQPLGRLLSEHEVAQLTIFLLSDASGMQTGTLVDLEQIVTGAPPRRSK